MRNPDRRRGEPMTAEELISSQPVKAYSYVRFSSPEQAKGDSLRRQTEAAQKYAQKHGLSLDEELTFQDLGLSAYQARNNASHGELADFLEAVKTGLVPKGSYLLVENLDRLSRRKARHALRILEEIVEAGITVVTLAGAPRKYTEEDLDGIGLFEVLFIFQRAHEESMTKGDRMKQAWEKKRRKAREEGERVTTWCPSWMDWDEELEEFVVDERKADIVRRIFKEYLKGTGHTVIAKTLNEEGVEPLSERAEFWHRSYVARVIKNPTVIGTLVPHETVKENGKKKRKALEPIPDYYPAVIDEDTYAKAQALKQSRAPARGRHANKRVKNIFGGLAHCGRCGGTMVRVNKGERKYLVCRKAKAGAGCTYDSVRLDYLEKVLVKGLPRLFADVPSGETDLDAQVSNLEGILMMLADKIENLQQGIEASGGSPTLLQQLEKRERQMREAKAEYKELRERQEASSGPMILKRIEELRDALEGDELNRHEANTHMRIVFERVTVDQASGMLAFEWKHGGVTEVVYAWPEEQEGED